MNSHQNRIQELYRTYHRALYGYIFSSCRNEELAGDILQDTFINFIRAFNDRELPPAGKCKTYLYRTARNLMINHSRSYDRRNISRDNESEIRSDRPGPEDEVIRIDEMTEKLKVFRKALSLMKEQERSLLILRHEDELSIQEIAEVLELPFSRIYRLLKKAERNLRAAVENKSSG